MSRLLRYCALILMLLLLVACSRFTQENFDRIESGMNYDEVVAILGTPTDSKSAGIGRLSGTHATWEDEQAKITIQFLNERVQTKQRRSKTTDGSAGGGG